MRNAGDDIFSLATTNAGGILSHLNSSPSNAPVTPGAGDIFIKGQNLFLFACDWFRLAFARARIGMRTLAANW